MRLSRFLRLINLFPYLPVRDAADNVCHRVRSSYHPYICIRGKQFENLEHVDFRWRTGERRITEHGAEGFAAGNLADYRFADFLIKASDQVTAVVGVDGG